MDYILGIDGSYHNVHKIGSKLDLSIAHSRGVRIGYFRVADGYHERPDWSYPRYVEQAVDLDWFIAPYFYHRADRPARDQARRFRDWSGDRFDLYPIIDSEGYPQSLAALDDMIGYTIEEFNLDPWIYTSPGYWGGFGIAGTDQKYTRRKLIVAQYPFFNPVPDIENRVRNWTPWLPRPWKDIPNNEGFEGWQFSKYGSGPSYGYDSQYIDLNYFRGPIERIESLSRKKERPDPDPVPVTIEDRVKRLEGIHGIEL